MEIFYNWIVVMVVQPYKFTKYQQIIHLKWIDFMACKLYLNKCLLKITYIFWLFLFLFSWLSHFVLILLLFREILSVLVTLVSKLRAVLRECFVCLVSLYSSFQSKSWCELGEFFLNSPRDLIIRKTLVRTLEEALQHPRHNIWNQISGTVVLEVDKSGL